MKIVSNKLIDLLCIVLFGIMSFLLLYYTRYINYLGGDTGDIAYSVLAGIAKTISSGELPLWNPYMWGGMTMAGIPFSQSLYPITYLVCKICYNEELGMLSYSAINYSVMIHVFIFAVGFYFLLRILHFRSLISFTVASLATFSGSGFMLSKWLNLFSSTVYIPLFIGLIILMMRYEKRRFFYAGLAGLVMGLSGLASIVGVLFLIVVFVMLYVIYMWSFRHEKRKMFRCTMQCFFTGFVGLSIMSASLLMVIRFLGDSYRYIPEGEAVSGVEQVSYESFIATSLEMNNLRGIIGGYYDWLALGIVLVFFVLLGLFCKKKKNPEAYWCGICLICVGLFYSCALLFTSIAYYIPFLNQIRESILYAIYFAIGSAIVGAYGLESVLDVKDDENFSDTFYNPVGFFVCFTIIIFNIFLPNKFTWQSVYMVCSIIGLLWLRKILNRRKLFIAVSAVLISLVCIEFYKFDLTVKQVGGMTKDEAVESVSRTNLNIMRLLDEKDLPSDKDRYRIMQWNSKYKSYPPNIWAVWGYNDIYGYMNPSPNGAFNVYLNWDLSKKMSISNIRYLICNSQERKKFLNGIEQAGLKEIKRVQGIIPDYDMTEAVEDIVFENTNRKGNAWLVENWIGYSNDSDINELNKLVCSADFDPFQTALVNTDTCNNTLKETYENVESSEVNMVDYNTNSIKFEVENAEEALMVTSEIMEPGWNVYIDGKKENILEVNTTYRGCVVPKGSHIVEYRYLPLEFVIGCVLACISVLSVLIIGIGGLWTNYKRK